MQTNRGWIVRSLFVLSLLLGASCDEGHPAGPVNDDDDDEESSQLGHSAAPLLEGRSVQASVLPDSWGGEANPELSSKRLGATDAMAMLFQPCWDTERLRLYGPNGVQELASGTAQDLTFCPAAPPLVSPIWTGFSADVDGVLATVCAAHWAQHIATATTPTFVSLYKYPLGSNAEDYFSAFLIHTDKNRLDKPWSDKAKPSDLINIFKVDPPSPSDAATWGLIAAELYHHAVVDGSALLQCANGNNAGATELFVTPEGEKIPARDYLATTVSDALVSSLEAAKEAETMITAVAESKRTSATNPTVGLVSSWTARHDSRLELAKLMADVGEDQFSQVQPVRLMQVFTPVGNAKRSFYTTNGGLPEAAASSEITYGSDPPPDPPSKYSVLSSYLVPYGAKAPTGGKRMTTWRVVGKPGVLVTTTADYTWTKNAMGEDVEFVRYEGWTVAAGAKTVDFKIVKTQAKTGTTSAALEFWPADMTVPAGVSDTGERFSLLAQGTPRKEEAFARFPVAAQLASNPIAKKAEELLRSARVNPCTSALAGEAAGWCREALGGVERSKEQIQDDLLAALKRPGAANDRSSRLTQLGVTPKEVDEAAKRIVTQAMTLGRAIVQDPVHRVNPNLVYGTQPDPAPVQPAYIYARVAGKPDVNGASKGVVSTSTEVRGDGYGRRSIFAALDYFRDQAEKTLAAVSNAEKSSTWVTILKEALAFSKQHVSYPLRVVTTAASDAASDQVTSLSLELKDFPITSNGSAAQNTNGDLGAKASCNAWLNEAGLQCALTGQIGGWPCDNSLYQFKEPNTAWATFDTSNSETWIKFSFAASMAPARTGIGQALLEGDRVYLTCDLGKGTEVVFATTIARPPTAAAWTAYLPPFSPSMQEHLTNTLASDVVQPELGVLSCAGVPSNVKLPLADELSDALTGANSVESSFAHYLKLSRQAATEADTLGEQIIEEGLSMDMRSEQARDELEDLCGGQINVPILQEYACSTESGANCDISALLSKAVASVPETVQNDLAGLQDCLGVGTAHDPVDASLGNVAMCAWRFYDGTGKALEPCTCPKSQDAWDSGTKSDWNHLCGEEPMACPILRANSQTCDRVTGLSYDAKAVAPVAAGKPQPPPAGYQGFAFYDINQPLNVSVSAADNAPAAEQDPGTHKTYFACGAAMAIRERLKSGDDFTLNYADIAKWATHPRLRQVADLVGYEQDLFGMPMVTIGGKPWIIVGNGNGPRSDKAVGWPCAPHPLVDSDIDGHDQLASYFCGRGGNVSMFCGGMCAGDTPKERAEQMTTEVAKRLRKAVVNLKALTGASTANVIQLSDVDNVPDLSVLPADMYIVGTLPDWHPRAGDTYARSRDGMLLCAMGGSSGTQCWRRDAYDALYDEEQRWPKDTSFLFLSTSSICPDFRETVRVGGNEVTGTLHPLGCSDIPLLFDGSLGEVNVRVKRLGLSVCPRIPPSLCTIAVREGSAGATMADLLCGEDLRRWESFPDAKPNDLSSSRRNANAGLASKLHADRSDLFDDDEQAYVWDHIGRKVWSEAPACVEDDCGKERPPTHTAANRIAFELALIETIDKTIKRLELTPDQREFLVDARRVHVRGALWETTSCASGTLPEDEIIGRKISPMRVLDALDLACEQLQKQDLGCKTLNDKSFVPKDIDDFPTLIDRVQCSADTVESAIEHMWLHGIPADVAKAIRERKIVNVFPTHRGSYGETIAALAAELENTGRSADGVVQALRDLKLEMSASALELNKLDLALAMDKVDAYIDGLQAQGEDLQSKISAVRTRQAISSNITSCIAAVASAAGDWTKTSLGSNVGSMVAATATCANSAVQIKGELEIASLQSGVDKINDEVHKAVVEKIKLGQRITEQEKQLVLVGVARQVNLALDKMNEALHAVKESYDRVQGHLATLEKIRQQARRAAAKVMLLGNDELGRVYSVNSAMRARMNTLRVRYDRARANAIRLAYLARRSVEQKLGVDLSRMSNDMTLVAAPRTWVDDLCVSSGIDYDRIRSKGDDLGFEYSHAYVGDWLDQLEAFVESYRVDFPFTDGSDLAIVSLRDEVVNVREPCSRDGWNSLYYTDGVFNELSVNTSNRGWEYTCSVAGAGASTASIQPSTETPFACSQRSIDCAATGTCDQEGDLGACHVSGDPTAAILSSAAASSCGSSPTIPGAGGGDGFIPSDGIFYHYRADSCHLTPSTVVNDKICADVNTGVDTLKWTSGSVPVLKPDAIGGRSVLELAPGTTLTGSTIQPAATAYTLTWVFRKGPNGYAIAHGNTTTMPDGKVPLARWLVNATGAYAGYHGFEQGTNWISPYNYKQQRYYALSRIAPQLKPRQGDILTLRGDASGVELWYNGVLRARGDQPAVASVLGSQVVNTQAGAGTDLLQLAEAVAYSRRLSDVELADLHGELAQYYSLDLTAPAYWFSAASLEAMRTAEGDARSGYLFTGDASIRDAGNGQAAQQALGGVEAQPLVSLAGSGPRALAFDGTDDLLGFRVSASGTVYRTDPPTGGIAEAAVVNSSEYSITAVANCQDGRAHRLLTTNHVASTPKVLLDIAAGGQVLIRNSSAGTTRTSLEREVNCGAPFVITLRGSQSLGTTEVFVNGALVLTDPQFTPTPIAPAYGGGSATGVTSLYFKGELAEAQVHLSALTDDDIVALHRGFARSYGIDLTDAGHNSGEGAPPASGPARMRQVVTVSAGVYWLSWYQKASEAPLTVLVEYLDEGDSEPPFTPQQQPADTVLSYADWSAVAKANRTKHMTEQLLASGWVRYFVQVEPRLTGRVSIGFLPGASPTYIAAPQLEPVDDWQSTAPEPYFPTGASLSQQLDACEDEDGSSFRELWHRGCEYYCPPGAGTDCALDGNTSDLPQRCFYELDFGLSLEQIEKGTLIPEAGFSRGNFNYRFDELALNLVGTAVKNCEYSSTPSSCFAGNFLQYSLYQSEPFRIRNYDGDVIRAPLPPGKIQQAKALLAERYLTNPLSSSDASLLGNYWRSELNGRPMDGTFKLRIYDADGLNFRALEDVQIALKYRYWTRSE